MNHPASGIWSADKAAELVTTHFGLPAVATPIHGEVDINFHIQSPRGEFLLKISAADQDGNDLAVRIGALNHLAATDPELPLARIRKSRDGNDFITVESDCGSPFHAHLLTWLPGTLLADFRPWTHELATQLGAMLGRLDRALENYAQAGEKRDLIWDLRRAPELQASLDVMEKDELRNPVAAILDRARDRVLPALSGSPMQVIHNDANDHNLLISAGDPWNPRICGLLDFGDLTHTLRVCEPAIAAAYIGLHHEDPAGMAAALAAGYHAENPLTETELDHLMDLVLLRMAVSMVVAAIRSRRDPENDYHQISQAPLRRAFTRLLDHPVEVHRARTRHACGLPAVIASGTLRDWLEGRRGTFAPVMDGLAGPVHVLDLSVSGRHARPPGENGDPGWEVPSGEGMAVGRYNEARLCYTTPQFSSPAGPRTVHLGIDLFACPGTAVKAPLAGRVVSVHDNNAAGDYGPTIILEHSPPDGPRFFTLFGHLGRESIRRLEPGMTVDRGEVIAGLGQSDENGGWAPHLHFQVMADLLNLRGNFPGVAAADERELWLEICPDPNLILDIPDSRFSPACLSPEEILTERKNHLNPTLSVSYRRPLTMVRGFMQFLYDHEGRAFLDGVNNVPHVGHSHPRVVQAIARQAAILNTNTRYLHPLLVTYARRILETLPPPLEVCFFANSGSEANDLALRLARQATKRRDILVLDAAYHGNLAGLIAVSPYKFDGSGGEGRPDGTHVFPMPDSFRGEFRNPADCGNRYAEKFSEFLAALDKAGTPPAAFLAESLPGCGGQIELPAEFLRRAFEAVRARGGLAIADEVQVGFGRVGDAFWGFQTQNARPDIVTMGKPMGNGHPLAAVVTTREVADAFVTGMEYFNTFGGNPVSCAAGLAVLDVIRDEGLRENARDVGGLLKDELRVLASRHPLVGDVRGRGLYLGVELVRDRDSLEPADREAAYISERMRDQGILISVDGPLHNVLKIKPPICFNKDDALRLSESLDSILNETFLQPS